MGRDITARVIDASLWGLAFLILGGTILAYLVWWAHQTACQERDQAPSSVTAPAMKHCAHRGAASSELTFQWWWKTVPACRRHGGGKSTGPDGKARSRTRSDFLAREARQIWRARPPSIRCWRNCVFSAWRSSRRTLRLSNDARVTPASLDAIVLPPPWSLRHINCRCRFETAAGHFQDLIRRTRVVFDKGFLSAR